jgi:hypothetical protein
MTRLLLPLLVALVSSCSAPGPGGRSPTPFDACVGSWRGTRTEGGGSGVAAMTVHVRPLLGGAGLLEELEVLGEEPYHGLHVVLFDRERGEWVRHYANAARGRFATLEREAGPDGALAWRNATPGRTRESRLIDEHPGPGRWRRTQMVSEDGGSTWRVLFVDELER